MSIYNTIELQKDCKKLLLNNDGLTAKQICDNFRPFDVHWNKVTQLFHEMLVKAFSQVPNWDFRTHLCVGNALNGTINDITLWNSGNMLDTLMHTLCDYTSETEEEERIRMCVIKLLIDDDPEWLEVVDKNGKWITD